MYAIGQGHIITVTVVGDIHNQSVSDTTRVRFSSTLLYLMQGPIADLTSFLRFTHRSTPMWRITMVTEVVHIRCTGSFKFSAFSEHFYRTLFILSVM